MTDSWLIFETSGRVGRVGIAVGGLVVAETVLDETRRHARDLAATTGRLLAECGLTPRTVRGVMVSVGPGSFTGLRVGIMSAKAFAFATECELIAVPTFDAIANRTPAEFREVDVIADALQRHVYTQRFVYESGEWKRVNELRIATVEEWRSTFPLRVAVSGPALAVYEKEIPTEIARIDASQRMPTIESVFLAGRTRQPILRTELAALEPIYLRGSSAEEKAKASHS